MTFIIQAKFFNWMISTKVMTIYSEVCQICGFCKGAELPQAGSFSKGLVFEITLDEYSPLVNLNQLSGKRRN